MVGGFGNLDSRGATGLRARNVPVGFNIKTFIKYQFPTGKFSGYAIGGGYDYVPARAGNAADTFSLPAYGVISLMFGYEHKKWSARVNIDNLADKVYAASSAQDYLIWPGSPRTIRFSVGRKF